MTTAPRPEGADRMRELDLTQRRQLSISPRREAEIGLEEPFELDEGLVVEGDEAEIPQSHAGLAEAVLYRVDREPRVVPHTGEALLPGRDHHFPVGQEARRALVVIGGNTEDVAAHLAGNDTH